MQTKLQFQYFSSFTDDIRRRETTARRRSSSAASEAKTRVPGSQKPTPNSKSAEDKQERNRKPSVSKTPTPRQKQEQPVTNRKMSTGAKEPARKQRSLPSTPGERKTSTAQQNGHNSINKGKTAPKSTEFEGKTTGRSTPPSSRQENKSVTKKKTLASSKPSKNDVEKKTTKEVNKADHEEERENGISSEKREDINGMDSEDGPIVISYGRPTVPCINLSDNVDQIDNGSHTNEISSPDEKYSQKHAMNGGRKLSACSLETDSDFTSDLLSDFTDTDYDIKSHRYSGLSETSSDFSFGTSPAGKLFHSVENERNALESNAEPDALEYGTSPTLKDCLMNLNMQGSVTPTMKRRIFEETSRSSPKEEYPSAINESVAQPTDKAMFFDVKQYNEKSPDENDVTVGSPRKLSLVQSLISSIEKRSNNSGDTHTVSKNPVSFTRSAPVSTGKNSMDESAVTPQRTLSSHEVLCSSLPSNDEQNKVYLSQLGQG